ncbi:MAG: hypothetical protein B1H40_02255, partial [Candidatus Latescibacteria bacterium 4484_181]
DFRAGEKTFHLLTQLASQLTEGEIVVQTYSSGDWTIRCFKNFDFDKFARRELADRRELNYPPWSRLVSIIKGAFRCQILLKGKSSKALRELVQQCTQKLKGKRGVRMTIDVDPVEMM